MLLHNDSAGTERPAEITTGYYTTSASSPLILSVSDVTSATTAATMFQRRGNIKINDGQNADIEITPHGTGKVVLDGINFPTADGTLNQVLATDGNGNLSFQTIGGTNAITFGDLSVGSNASASGEGGISYNNTNGVFTFTPPDLSSFVTNALQNIVEDTTPQLGGDLDLNSNDITGTGNITITGNFNNSTGSVLTRSLLTSGGEDLFIIPGTSGVQQE